MLFRRACRATVRALALLGLLMVLATCTPFVSWYARRLAGPWTDPPGDVLIVLGGSATADGYISRDTYWRCVYAVRVFRQGRFRRLLVSGAGVAPLMRQFLIAYGVPAEAIQVEANSASTRENALQAVRLLAGNSGRKVLLTSDFHMFRARRAFARAGLETGAWPVPDALKGGWERRWPAFLEEIVETAKIGYYFLRRWL